jgi:hypothetical protein
MVLVRVLAALSKPAVVAGAIAATAAGGWFAVDSLQPHGHVSPLQAIQGKGQRLLISEFGNSTDTIVAVNPADVSDRRDIVTIDHAYGYGVFAVLSPDGKAVAYTGLPPDTTKPGPDAPATAAVVDVDGDVVPLADDVDLLIPPVWSPDSASIVVRKNTPGDGGAGSFELLLLSRDGSRSTITTWSTAAVFPIAFSPDGSELYFAALNNSGTDLYRVAPDGSDETKVAHLSDEIARDWRLSPDGSRIAYSVAESGASPRVVAKIISIDTGAISDALPLAVEAAPGTVRGQFNPTWNRNGELTIASLKPNGGGDTMSLDATGSASELTTNDDSFDLPLDWSPDGGTLAVRHIEGSAPADASASHVELVHGSQRENVSDVADVLIVGWVR